MDKIQKKGYTFFNTKNGDKVEMLFTMVAWAILEEKGFSLDTLQDDLIGSKGVVQQLKCLAAIFSAGHENFSAKENKDAIYSQDEFFEMMEEDVDEEVIKNVTEALLSVKVLGRNIIDTTGKQKAAK